MGRNNPAVNPTSICTTSHRCHVSGKGIIRFGGQPGKPDNFTKKFTKPFVLRMASSSVILKDGSKFIGSGTLIDEHVVLTSAHVVDQAGTKDIKVGPLYECHEGTAPPGESWQYYGPGMRDKQKYKAGRQKWCGCAKLTFPVEANVTKILERGSADELDYALLAIKWPVDPMPSPARKFVLPNPDRSIGVCLLLVQHPFGEPTQACAGRVIQQEVPCIHKESGGPLAYATASFTAEHGSSGSGVFNEEGHIVGIFQGVKSSVGGTKHSGCHFLMLNRLEKLTRADKKDPSRGRINLWFEAQRPYKDGDKQYF